MTTKFILEHNELPNELHANVAGLPQLKCTIVISLRSILIVSIHFNQCPPGHGTIIKEDFKQKVTQYLNAGMKVEHSEAMYCKKVVTSIKLLRLEWAEI